MLAVFSIGSGGFPLSVSCLSAPPYQKHHQLIGESAMKVFSRVVRNAIGLFGLSALALCVSSVANAEPGRMIWKHQFEGQLWSSPVFDNGTLFFGCDDGKFYAFDVQKREVKWSFETKNIIRSVANVHEGVVTFASDDGNLYALNQEDGAELWRFNLGGSLLARKLPSIASPPYSFDYMSSSPVYHAGVIYIGSPNGELFAIDHKNGKERWRFATTEMIRCSPLVYRDKVYVGSWNGHFYALDSNTGEEVWSFDCGDVIQGWPAFGGGKIIVGSRSAKIFALNAETGKEEWVYVSEIGSWIESTPVVEGSVIYIGTSDALKVMALDLGTGAEIWNFATAGWSWATPTLAGGTVYIGGIPAAPYIKDVVIKAGFYAIDQKTGQEKWSFTPEPVEDYITGGVYARAVVDGGVVYVCGLDGTLYGLAE
jgi:outer membrane protein assembly factor BamB